MTWCCSDGAKVLNGYYQAPLFELIKLSAELGSDSTLIQAAGGNTSVKFGQSMWIKASGKWLVVADSTSASLEVMLLCQAEVLARIAQDARLRSLCEAEMNELVDWNAEKYRRPGSY